MEQDYFNGKQLLQNINHDKVVTNVLFLQHI